MANPIVQQKGWPFNSPTHREDIYRGDRFGQAESIIDNFRFVAQPAPLGNQTGGLLFSMLGMFGIRNIVGIPWKIAEYEAPLYHPTPYYGIYPLAFQPQLQKPRPWEKFRLGMQGG